MRSNQKHTAAAGIRAHSGWAALVVVAGTKECCEVIERRKVLLADPKIAGTKQPFHFAEPLPLQEAEAHLSRCAKNSAELALHAIREVCAMLDGRGYSLSACALLTASGRTLPDLAGILASHALIHTAEGEFYRDVFRDACRNLRLPVSAIRERNLFELAAAELALPGEDLKRRLSDIGKSIGPPWTQDHKHAALAAWMVLAQR